MISSLETPSEVSALRITIGRLTGLASIIAAVISGYNFINWYYGEIPPVPETGLFFAALTGVLVLITVILLRPPMIGVTISHEPFTTAPINWIVVILGLAALIFLGAYGRNFSEIESQLPIHAQFLLFAGGTFALLLGFGAFAEVSWQKLVASFKAIPRLELFLLILIIVVAFVVRVYRLGDLVHAPLDEDHYNMGVLDLIDLPFIPIFSQIGGLAGVPHLLPYFQLWFMPFFGGALDSIRIPTMIFGVLTIPAIYMLGRALFDKKIGLLAAAFLAVFPPHIHFSRLALFNVPDTLFGVLAIGSICLAFRYNRQRDFVFAGVFLGLSGLFYEGGRILYFSLSVLFILYVLLTTGSLRRSWRGLLIMAVCYIGVSLPYLAIIIAHQDIFFLPRLQMEAQRPSFMLRDIREGQPILDVLKRHWDEAMRGTFYHTIYWSDGSHFYYGGKTSILLWYMIPFYLLVLFFTAFRSMRSGFILWVWLIGATLGISFVSSTDWTVRFLVMFPAMAILVAVGLRYLPELIWPVRLDKRILWGILAILMLAGSGINLTYYFNEHLPFLNDQFRALDFPDPNMDFYDAFYTVSNDKNTTLYFLGIRPETIYNPVLDHEIRMRQLDIKYIVEGDAAIITAEWLKALPRDRNLVVVISPKAEDLLATIKSVFPNAEGPLPGLVDTVPERARYLIFRVPVD
jgi:hypothetical protein